MIGSSFIVTFDSNDSSKIPIPTNAHKTRAQMAKMMLLAFGVTPGS